MGLTSSISKLITKIFIKQKKLTMIGLDAAGKTTILFKLKLGEVVQTIPTIGFNIETVQYKNIIFDVWDTGGGEKLRPLWRHYYEGTNAGIFVFDSQDRYEERWREAAEMLHQFSSDIEKYGIPLLIFANKQDDKEALSIEEIKEILHPNDLKQKNWYIQLCSAKTGEGLLEGLDWIGNIVCPRK